MTQETLDELLVPLVKKLVLLLDLLVQLDVLLFVRELLVLLIRL